MTTWLVYLQAAYMFFVLVLHQVFGVPVGSDSKTGFPACQTSRQGSAVSPGHTPSR